MNLDDDIRSRGDGYQSFVVFTDRSKWFASFHRFYLVCDVLKIYIE